MRILVSSVLVIASSIPAVSQSLKPVAERVAQQNAVFEEQYETDLRTFPERATAFGDYRYNDRLNDFSLEAIVQHHKTDEDFLRRLEAIPTTGFSDQDQLSHDLLLRMLQQRVTDFNLKEYEMPINQQNGIHTSLADLPQAEDSARRMAESLREAGRSATEQAAGFEGQVQQLASQAQQADAIVHAGKHGTLAVGIDPKGLAALHDVAEVTVVDRIPVPGGV